ncbi:hypothetical protein BO94DRAFT_582029 [Aspergillus sclerotioniger CBS 115572]|uniref:Transcription factor domain-containing protein n=1 Tax=Aspergillus sclerotioniger CBS 115572 TaxID=1450535 RepID=A0A317XDN1_9EURO|nr:hypothetical protein BO94DRAFT_582029 [Aspergillus sclerotioniger CBS 115572]PWY94640.1 hypothetical protein BO94DRAFT_582029 [Aspergillus sclerotioniger CBS 115572]
MLAVVHRTDKKIATLMARPPRLPHQYCDADPPLDISDEDLFLDSPAINSVLASLDGQGWHREARLMPATVTRMRHFLSILREQVLELSLGSKFASDYGDRLLQTCHLYQGVWNQIPFRFHYDPTCWTSCDVMESLARILIRFDYQFRVLHLQRIRCKENNAAIGDLMDTSLQVLSMIMDLARNYQPYEVQRPFPCIYLSYGIPAAGILVTELYTYARANRPLPASTPRSEVIRLLSVLIEWVRSTEMLPLTTAVEASELTKVISQLLDDTLNHQHGISVEHAAENVAAPVIRDPGDSLPQGFGDGFHLPSETLGVGLAGEEFLSWLNELDLDMVSGERFI